MRRALARMLKVAEVLESCRRETDLCARYGGEEFAIICRDIDEAAGAALADRLGGTTAGADADLAADLERYANNEPIKARPATIIYRTRKLIRRHVPLVATSSAVTCCSCGSRPRSWSGRWKPWTGSSSAP